MSIDYYSFLFSMMVDSTVNMTFNSCMPPVATVVVNITQT